MKQLFLRQPGDLVLRDAPTPQAGPGEVVVRVRAALTCGTDVKFFRRGHPKFPLPTPFGHEFSGDIVEVGAGVEGFAPGQPVMLAPTAPCGECDLCRRGYPNLCPQCMERLLLGAFSEFVKVPAHIVAQNMYPKPDHLDYFEAAVMEPLACVVYGLDQVQLGPQDRVVVIGAGPIGLLHLLLARHRGAGEVVMLGRREVRLAAARAFGADRVVDVGEGDLDGHLAEVTGGEGASVVIECTGQPEVWRSAIDGTAPGGTALLFGGCKAGSEVRVPMHRVVEQEITLLGAFHFTPEAVRRARELLVSGELKVGGLISGIHPMSQFRKVFRELMEGEAIKFGIQTDR